MQPMQEALLREVARGYGIEYDTAASLPRFSNNASPHELTNQPFIETRMAREFPESREQLFARIANIEDHARLFSHLTALNVISSKAVAQVIGENQFIIVEGLAEGGSKLGIKLMTLVPPERIECELFTDLFRSAVRAGPKQDSKSGTIFWEFYEQPSGGTIMQIRSRFQINENSAYIRGTVDHVWLDFFENVMIDLHELKRSEKKCAPFPGKSQQNRRVA